MKLEKTILFMVYPHYFHAYISSWQGSSLLLSRPRPLCRIIPEKRFFTCWWRGGEDSEGQAPGDEQNLNPYSVIQKGHTGPGRSGSE